MDGKQKLLGNPEHTGISTAIPLILLGSIVVFYAILSWLIPFWLGGKPVEFLVVNAILAVVLSLAFIAIVDPILKRVWPSGHAVLLEKQQLRYEKPDEKDRIFRLNHPFKLICWKFKMSGYTRFGRERQIKRGSVCYACRLQQDDEQLVVHTYVVEGLLGQGFDLTGGGLFVELDMEEVYDTTLSGRFQQWRLPGGRPELPSSLIVSEQGRYWLAERSRWEHGVELHPDDFKKFMAHLLQFEDQATT